MYLISQDKLPEIDIYEEEGSLYKRRSVHVCSEKGKPVDAYTYVYNHSVAGKVKISFRYQPWFYGAADTQRE